MDPIIISIIGIVIFLGLLALGQHIGLSLMVAGFVGMLLLRGFDPALSELKTISWNTVSSFTLAVIPLFMLMGNFAMYSGITAELFDTCYKWLGRFRGGLGFVAIGTSSLFHCFCGSATATTATIGTVCFPEMTRYRYKPVVSAGIIASSSAFGLLIPPSIGFIVYCTMAGVSVGKMFAAGIIPAIIVIGLSFVTVVIMAKRDPEAMPQGEKFTFREKVRSLKGILGFAVLFILVLGGIFSGFFSPSEGGAIGAFGSFIIMAIRRKASFANIWRSLKDSIKTTVMIFIIMIGANIFGTFLAMTQMPAVLAESLSTMGTSPYVVLWIVVAVYLVLGMCIDTLPLITILTPIFWPLVLAMNWNPLWFGVIMVMCMLIGLISPPDGIPCYIMSGIAKVPLMSVFKASFPFLIMLAAATILFIYVEPISTWLPSILNT
ncbi:TRAP transporter, DctM subunit [Sporobacter termitidis DSM 10068]|uniref:TRAP transporter, DctM subunit n=1 Tax=Sporobacter termitidis DSM 10068 TaxID=1123282 RepID=A0A1M5Y6J9_9FIRM|nr:TRAP transporter large permease [Sporobacter termitidis]SHI07444.1 TRAP transporter, DctM subunit [Sporobacter termitidis DSM 10068]